MRPFISLCMIVKNEEKVLERCLTSVAHLVNEVVIVDTGSTDKTKEIAAKFTSNIYDFKWIADFSAARNFAAEKATGEWILVLDADEYVDEENFRNFIDELKAEKDQYDSYYAKILNFTGKFGESLAQNYHDRIYRNNGEIRYYRNIHEQFENIIGKPLKNKNSNLLIFHSGYLKHTVSEKNKSQRNKELLDKEMDIVEQNAFDYFNLGNEYSSLGDYEKALESYLQAYKLKKDFRLAWVSNTLVQIVICLISLKRYNDAISVIKDAEDIYSNSAEFPYLKGEIFFQRGQLDDSKQELRQILDNQQKYTHVILRPDFKDIKPHTRLGELYLYQEDYNQAIYHFTSVLNINKYDIESIKKVIFILNKFHTNEEIADFLYKNGLVNSKNIEIYTKLCFEFGYPKLGLSLLNMFKNEDNNILLKIAIMKIFCIHNERDFQEFEDILKFQVLKKLLDEKWINIVDLLLIYDCLAKQKDNIKTILKPFDQIHEYKMLINLLNGQADIKMLDENLIIYSIQTLLNYKKYSLCNSLLENIETVDEKIRLRVAGLLFSNGFKVEALQLYEKCDWSLFGEQDFINIITSLLETENGNGAVEVANYAISAYSEDFRFYKYILENTEDVELFNSIYKKAKDLFVGSITLDNF